MCIRVYLSMHSALCLVNFRAFNPVSMDINPFIPMDPYDPGMQGDPLQAEDPAENDEGKHQSAKSLKTDRRKYVLDFFILKMVHVRVVNLNASPCSSHPVDIPYIVLFPLSRMPATIEFSIELFVCLLMMRVAYTHSKKKRSTPFPRM